MIAAQIIDKGSVQLTETQKPLPRQGHALIRPIIIALCGSDLRKVFLLPDSEYPLAPGISGHEIIGVVEEIDMDYESKDAGVRPGDIVLALIPGIENGMAEYFITPAENVLPLPGVTTEADRSTLEAYLMAQQLGTVVYACKRIRPEAGHTAVVIGQGSAGLFFNAMLKRMGLTVISMDIVDARVAAGLKFGADHAFNNRKRDPREAISSLTKGAMADLVIEAVGEPETINLSAHLVRTNGQLLYFGVPHEPEFAFDYLTLYRAYCYTTSTGSSGFEPGKPSYREALDLIASGSIDVSEMVTHRFPFNDVAAAYRLAHERTDGAIKVLVEMPEP